nr:hypothetical protein [Salinicola tamaricis]
MRSAARAPRSQPAASAGAGPPRADAARARRSRWAARALLSLSAAKQRQAAHEVVSRELTVRQTEALVSRSPRGARNPMTSARRRTWGGSKIVSPTCSVRRSRFITTPRARGAVTIRYTSARA